VEMRAGRLAAETVVATADGRAGVDLGACAREVLFPPRRRSRFRRDRISFRLPGRTSILTTSDVRDLFSTVTGGGRASLSRVVLDARPALAASPDRLSRAESSRSVSSVD
jgi:hypothetical protein